MDWTEEAIATLRRLWAEGLSTAEIGRRMGISKNAVVGKAHRLSLSARPSPIRRVPGQSGTARLPRSSPRPSVPRPLSVGAPAAISDSPMPGSQTEARPVASVHAMHQRAPQPRPIAPPRAAVPNPMPSRIGNSTCCWPIGDPGTPGFRFCTSGALAGKPYCEAHAQVAYVRARPDRREDAA